MGAQDLIIRGGVSVLLEALALIIHLALWYLRLITFPIRWLFGHEY